MGVRSSAPTAQAKGEKEGFKARKWRNTLSGYAFILPFLVGYVIFTLYPIVQSFWISLHNWELVGTNIQFVAFENYTRLFQDKLFWSSLQHTLLFLVLAGPVLIVLGLLFALLLNRTVRGIGFFRTIFYLPNVLSVAVTGVIWSRIFASGEGGLINAFLQGLGLEGVPWLSSGTWAMPVVAATTIWSSVGFNMLIFLAGLQDIPTALYDAAKIDGANRWQGFRYITLPGLRRSLAFVFVLQVIGSFNVFGIIDVMTQGGPAGYTRTIAYYIYERTFEYWQMGYGASMAVILFAILLGVSLAQLHLFRERS